MRLEPVERRPEQVGSEDVDRGVALAQLELLGVASPASTIASTVPSGRADDASVRAHVVRLEGEDGRSRLLAPVRLEELLEQLGREERRVAGEDEQLGGSSPTDGTRGADRVAGAERALLHRDLDVAETHRGSPARRPRRAAPGPSGRAASSTQSTIRRPRIGCRCFGTAERMRVPSPPAITTAASVGRSLGRVKWLGRQDSNLGSRDQNPLPYHLATPQ